MTGRLIVPKLALLSVITTLVAFERTHSQDWAKASLEASPRHMEYVTVGRGDRNIECFVAYPEVSHRAHAVVVIHDISAMSDWIRSVADQLAAAGYIAIVPDMISEKGPQGGGTDEFASIDDARRAVSELKADEINADLDAVADYVRKLPAAKGTVSVAGFCWGGGQSLRYATHGKDLAAAFVFYGYEPITADDAKNVTCPIYGFYAENDARINAARPSLEKLLADADKKFEPVVYAGAGHGFMRHGQDPTGTQENKQAREDAWNRWKTLLKER